MGPADGARVRAPRRGGLALAVFFLVLFAATAGRADGGQDEAGVAYDAAVHAYAAHDWRTAAREFARADELAPLPVVLGLALDAVIKTDDAVLGMTLVDRARSRSALDARMSAKVNAVAAKFERRVGVVRLVCGAEPFCELVIADRHVADTQGVRLPAGTYRAELHAHEKTETRIVRVDGGRTTNVDASTSGESSNARAGAGAVSGAAPAEASSSPGEADAAGPPDPARAGGAAGSTAAERTPPRRSGLPPACFWIAAGATALIGVAAVVSAVDLMRLHDAFAKDPSNRELSSSGNAAQARTNVLLGAFGLAAVGTAALGVWAIRWDDGGSSRTTWGMRASGAF